MSGRYNFSRLNLFNWIMKRHIRYERFVGLVVVGIARGRIKKDFSGKKTMEMSNEIR